MVIGILLMLASIAGLYDCLSRPTGRDRWPEIVIATAAFWAGLFFVI